MSTTRWPAAGLSPMFVPRHDSSGCPVAAYLFSRDGMQPWFNPVGRVGWSSVVSGLTDCPICWGSQAAASQLPPCRPLCGCWKLCSASVLYRSRISTWHCWPMWLEPLRSVKYQRLGTLFHAASDWEVHHSSLHWEGLAWSCQWRVPTACQLVLPFSVYCVCFFTQPTRDWWWMMARLGGPILAGYRWQSKWSKIASGKATISYHFHVFWG